MEGKNIRIDWGDGMPATVKPGDFNGLITYYYPGSSARTITISGVLSWFYLNELGITQIDVRDAPELLLLSCQNNYLTSLDLSRNTRLRWLGCDGNSLTSLDVSKNTALNELTCLGNSLSSLDVSANTKLEWLDCESNQIDTADAIDDLFDTLPPRTADDKGRIYIGGNGGADDCDVSIARDKNWVVLRKEIKSIIN